MVATELMFYYVLTAPFLTSAKIGVSQSNVSGVMVIAQVADKAFGYVDAPIQRVCAPSVPLPFARNMEDFTMVDEQKIADRVRKLVRGEI